MIKDITLGQYYPAESPIHSLDSRTKIAASLVYIVSLFIGSSFAALFFAALFFLVVLKISRVPLFYIVRGLKPILFLIALTMLVNLFLTPGTVILKIFFLKITKEGLSRSFFMAARLTLLISGSSLLTLTTKPVTLTDGLERLLSPFKAVGLPAHELAMMMTIALRFIPTMLGETDRIIKAQTSRGADFEEGGIIKRAKNLIPILVPLFVSAFRIAGELALAMEARCYRGGKGRTRMNEARFKKADALAFFIMALYLISFIAIARFAPF